MLRWAATFFVIAMISALFGFSGISHAAADIARILFFVFMSGFVIALAAGLFLGAKLRRLSDGSR